MTLVVATRMKVRKVRYLPRFLQGSLAAARQGQRTPGFLDGRLRAERDGTFWTLTLWESGRDMTGFRDSGIHAVLTRHLADWASEAAFGVWSTDSAELPAWDRASRQLAAHPRFPPFDAPAPAPRNRQAPTARRFGLDVPIPTRRTPDPAAGVSGAPQPGSSGQPRTAGARSRRQGEGENAGVLLPQAVQHYPHVQPRGRRVQLHEYEVGGQLGEAGVVFRRDVVAVAGSRCEPNPS